MSKWLEEQKDERDKNFSQLSLRDQVKTIYKKRLKEIQRSKELHKVLPKKRKNL